MKRKDTLVQGQIKSLHMSSYGKSLEEWYLEERAVEGERIATAGYYVNKVNHWSHLNFRYSFRISSMQTFIHAIHNSLKELTRNFN